MMSYSPCTSALGDEPVSSSEQAVKKSVRRPRVAGLEHWLLLQRLSRVDFRLVEVEFALDEYAFVAVRSELVQVARVVSWFIVVRKDEHWLEMPLGMYELLAACKRSDQFCVATTLHKLGYATNEGTTGKDDG